jgi:hypothetical protein
MKRFNSKVSSSLSHDLRKSEFLHDRFGACHFLKPVLENNPDAFFTNGDDPILQYQWATENGLKPNTSLTDILLAQIENHKTEVFYNLDPMRYQSDFLKKLPGSVKRKVAWRAAPSPNSDFGAYDFILCNFPSILERFRAQGYNAEYFAPAHDPVMDEYALNPDRPIDILFVGGYSKHHKKRAETLEIISQLANRYNIHYHLDISKFTKLSESIFGIFPPLSNYRRPASVVKIAKDPIFGRDLYHALSHSKIVLNGAIDMAGNDRGNMRCFEALGCQSLLLTDQGNYPNGMTSGKQMVCYSSTCSLIEKCHYYLDSCLEQRMGIAKMGYQMIKMEYSKDCQWGSFLKIIA